MRYIIWWKTAPQIITILFFFHRENAIECLNDNQHTWLQVNRFTKEEKTNNISY